MKAMKSAVQNVLIALGFYYIGAYMLCAFTRLLFPFEVDYTESALVAVLARMAAHQPIYAPPGIHFTSMVYTPLNFKVAAVLDQLHPGGYIGLRLTSILATLLTAVVIALVARKHRAPLWSTALALGVFFGAYTRCALAQDHSHVDALSLLFSLSSLVVLFECRKTFGFAALAGVLGGLAFVTKQTMVVFIAIPVVWMALSGQFQRAVLFGAAATATAVGLLAAWGLIGDPWFFFWVFRLEAGAKIRLMRVFIDAPAYMLLCLPAGLLVGILGTSLGFAPRQAPRRWFADPWAVTLLAFAGMAAIARGKDGGGYNVFLPVFALAAIQLARQAHLLAERWPRFLSFLFIIQLLTLFYHPAVFIPTKADRAVAERLIEQIRKFPGEVYVPAYPEYAVRAGKSWWVHYTLVCGLAQFDPTLRNALGAEIRAQHFGAIFAHADIEPKDVGLCDLPDLDKYYEPLAEKVDMPNKPAAIDFFTGRPSAAGLGHGGRLSQIWVPRHGVESK